MKNQAASFSLPRAALTALVFAVAAAIPAGAQTVDPDPEIFDGTRTKSKDDKKQEQQAALDDWELGNLIIYDSEEQGNNKGGQGVAGGNGPGFEIPGQGGMGGGGIPMPPIGGGGIAQGEQTMSMPTSMESSKGAQGANSASTAGASGGKPGEVSIGDPDSKIKTTASNLPNQKTTSEDAGEPTEQGKGEDTTQVPKAASGQQSGKRGGGVETGDGIPTDL
jgi:hypothetical protein